MINTMLSTSQALYGVKVLDYSRTSARLNLQRCSMTPTEHAASERLLLTLCNASRSAQYGDILTPNRRLLADGLPASQWG